MHIYSYFKITIAKIYNISVYLLHLTYFLISKHYITVFIYNFVIIKMKKQQHIVYSWLLLLIIVSMQLVNSFHFHEPQITTKVECDMCSHNIHHSGHLTGDQYHMHPCLSCLLSSNEFIEPQSTHISSTHQFIVKLEVCPFQTKPITYPTSCPSRASPLI